MSREKATRGMNNIDGHAWHVAGDGRGHTDRALKNNPVEEIRTFMSEKNRGTRVRILEIVDGAEKLIYIPIEQRFLQRSGLGD